LKIGNPKYGSGTMSELTGSFIALCWGIFFVFIVVSTFSAKRVVESDRRWIYSWLVLVAFVAAFFVIEHAPHLSAFVMGTIHRSSTPMISFCADMIVLAGLVISLWARIELGRNWNLNPSSQEDHELIERGPYVYVRHPMYSGLILMLLGAVIWYGRWIGARSVSALRCSGDKRPIGLISVTEIKLSNRWPSRICSARKRKWRLLTGWAFYFHRYSQKEPYSHAA
jgi:protein-S-isoprenylcysteine O-methyltransferase Ste14